MNATTTTRYIRSGENMSHETNRLCMEFISQCNELKGHISKVAYTMRIKNTEENFFHCNALQVAVRPNTNYEVKLRYFTHAQLFLKALIANQMVK